MSFEGIPFLQKKNILRTSDNITVNTILDIPPIVQIVFGRVYHFDACVSLFNHEHSTYSFHFYI